MSTILLIVVILVAALLVFAATRPAEFRIERSARIEAPPTAVAPLILDFHQWARWSPWEKLDPALERRYSGAPSGVGAVYDWNGNKKVGQGRMEILSATPSAIVIKLDFIKPFAASNQAEFRLTPAAAGTDVAWAMTGRRPFMMKLMGLVLDMDKMVGKDFEAGLAAMQREAGKP